MHRLISARNLYQTSFHGFSVPANSTLRNSSLTEIKCSYCRKILWGRHDIGKYISKVLSNCLICANMLYHKLLLLFRRYIAPITYVALRNFSAFISETLFSIRHQSTRTASALRSHRKKSKHKNYKQYGELLEGMFMFAVR